MLKKGIVLVAMLAMAISLFAAVAFQVSTPSQLIGGPAASGRVGDYILQNSAIKVLIGAKDNFHGYMKSGGNILDASLADVNNDLFDEVHTYYGWPKQAMYTKIFVKDDGKKTGNAVIEAVGYKNDMPSVKIDTTYTLSGNANYVVIRTSLTNTSDKDVGPFVFGDAAFFGYARPFLYGNGFSFKNFNSPLVGGVGDGVSYGFTTTQVDPATGKMRPVHIAYIYSDPEILPKTVLKAGQTITYEREFVVAPTLSDVEKTVFDLRNISYSTLKGKMVDIFGNTVPFVKLVVKDDKGLTVSETRTNAAGEYTLYLQNGNYSLNVEQPGYVMPAKSFVVTASGNLPTYVVSYVKKNSFVWPVYLTNVSTNSVYVNLKTLLPSQVTVKYAKSADYEKNNTFDKSVSESAPEVYHHIMLQNLEPNTRYSYMVVSKDPLTGTMESKVFSFVTTPIDDSLKDFSFVVYGDTRTFQLRNKLVCDAIAKDPSHPRLVFNIGDLTMDGRVLANWDRFFWAIHNLAANVPYYPVLGNHEYNSSYFYDAFPLPKGGGTDEEEWYSFNYGPVHFVVLDADVILMEKDAAKMQEQTDWLVKDLKANKDAKFKVVIFHQPFWTNTTSETGNPELVKYWKDVFEKYGVNIVFNGHYHAYERFEVNGVTYITTAGGGAPMYQLKPKDKWWPFTVKSIADIHHYTVIHVEGNKMVVTVKGVLKQINDKQENAFKPYSGILDQFTIESH